ncbi:MAG: DsbA family protein [Xanthobacteraceae bacterium]|jgi:protein-disulfide isomerase
MTRRLSTFLSGALALAVLAAWLAAAAAQQRDPSLQYEYPLVGDEGQQVPNHTVRLLGPIDWLPGVVVVGNLHGKKTLTEFYDLNCPYCRAAAAAIGDMLDRDPELRLVLVPFPVLGVGSIEASRVELAIAKLGTPQQFYAFHRQIFSQRGTADAQRALEVARGLGFDERVLTAVGDSDETTRTMKNLFNLGDALGLLATPSFIVGGVAILGFPGQHELQAITDAAASCGKVMC